MHKIEKVNDVGTFCTEIFAKDLRDDTVKKIKVVKNEKVEKPKNKKGDK
jgi:hypothetical protein